MLGQRRKQTLSLRAKHTNASAIRHATGDAATDAKISWLSTHQCDDQRDLWGLWGGGENRRDNRRDNNVTVLKIIASPIALAYVVPLVFFGNDQIVHVFDNQRDVAREIA